MKRTRASSPEKHQPQGVEGKDSDKTQPRRRLYAATVLVVLVALALAGWKWFERRRREALLPPEVDTSSMPRLMAQALDSARSEALAAPDSIEALGRLCMTYHANLFNSEAKQCYTLLAARDRASWKWPYYHALIAEDLGELPLVEQLLREAIARHSNYSLVWLRLGKALSKQGRGPEAIELLRACIKVEREHPTDDLAVGSKGFPIAAHASLQLGETHSAQGEQESARQVLERLTQVVPDFGPAHRQLARVLRALNAETSAKQSLAKAEGLAPFSPPADPLQDELSRLSRSTTYLLKQFRLAQNAQNASWAELLVRRAVASDPKDDDALAELGLMLLELRRVDEAFPHLLAYRALGVRHDTNLVRMGRGLAEAGRAKEAMDFLSDARKINPNSHLAYEGMCFALTLRGDFLRGEQACLEALRLRSDSFDAQVNLSVIYIAIGQIDKAEPHARAAVNAAPLSVQALSNLAMVLVRKGQFADARKHLESALEVKPGDAKLEANLARVLGEMGNESLAVDKLRGLVKREPEDRLASTFLVWLLATSTDAKLRNGREGVELAERTVKKSPSMEGLDALAAAYAEVGRFDDALSSLEQAIKLAQTARNESMVLELRRRQALYQKRTPYRRTPRSS